MQAGIKAFVCITEKPAFHFIYSGLWAYAIGDGFSAAVDEAREELIGSADSFGHVSGIIEAEAGSGRDFRTAGFVFFREMKLVDRGNRYQHVEADARLAGNVTWQSTLYVERLANRPGDRGQGLGVL